jgi:hypothetical protein
MSTKADISQQIIELVKRENPETVEELVKLMGDALNLSEEKAFEWILKLENQGELKLSSRLKMIPRGLDAYFFSLDATWYWIIIALSISTTISVFTIQETDVPFIYVRYVLGSIFVLFLPGYSLIKALFPSKEIDDIERIALSIGMSLALVPLVGLLLNYTPWGIRLAPITLSLLSLTIVLSAVALIREHQRKTLNTINRPLTS